MTYNFTVQNVGTYWWHAHYSTQVRSASNTLTIPDSRNGERPLENRWPLWCHGAPLGPRACPDDRAIRSRSGRVAERLVQHLVRPLRIPSSPLI